MAQKTDTSAYVAIAIAPVALGFVRVGAMLEAACAAAGLDKAGPIRLLGTDYRWTAVELPVTVVGHDPAGARKALEAGIDAGGDKGVDIALIPASGRRKRLLICDMDSTIIQQECLDELAAYAGLKDQIAAITARAMAGELDFEGALTERVGMLKGLSLSALDQCYRERISLMPGARTLTATMRAHGAHSVLVSGGFTYFTSRIAALAGFDAHRGNRLIDDGSALTGEVARPILGRAAKLEALDAFSALRSTRREDAVAMGDGANDLAMIEAAGLGLAVHAKPIVASAADAAISRTDLTAALYYQGYTDSEIIWQD